MTRACACVNSCAAGELITAIARRVLFLPVLRFVDDYFAAEREEVAWHAMKIFARHVFQCMRRSLVSFEYARMARLVRVVLGSSAVANRKLETGNPLVILGVLVKTNLVGATYVPPPEKIRQWISLIRHYLESGILGAGEASKLAGRLNWASQEIFDKLGRALLVPIYAHMRSRSSVIGWELKLALRWWLQTLERGMCQVRVWREIHTEPLQLLCDARCVHLRTGLCVPFALFVAARQVNTTQSGGGPGEKR